MDNQHKLIKGYRDLSQEEIEAMNQITIKASEVGALINSLKTTNADQRWVSIAQTDLQKGFMSLVRSVAKPDSF